MAANTNGRPLWSAEDRLDVILAALWDANKLVGINWDNVAAILATRFPDKTPRALRYVLTPATTGNLRVTRVRTTS
jgi:hypothetical protein